MPHLKPRLIDCSTQPDLLAGWPVASSVRGSGTAMALILDLASWTISGADLDTRAYDIDADERMLIINTGGLSKSAVARSHYFQNILILRTFAGLRAAWQAERADEAFVMHRIDLWPLLNRIIEADIAAMALRMAHELRELGNDALWRHALGDSSGDMAAVYVRALERSKNNESDAQALGAAFLQWFERDARIEICDHETLSDMDSDLAAITLDGRGALSEGAIRCLTIDPVSCMSYLGPIAGEVAGNPAWRSIDDPVAEAHFLQIMDEIGTTRVGGLTIRDAKLAARLFPDQLVRA